MEEQQHQRYMQRALELAALGKGSVSPNPMVGAVLVYNDRIVSEGWHHEYGDVHAEVDCLVKVPSHLRHLIPQCTMYVTLEPCAHTGKQPPCAPRIVQEGIRKVVVCNDDPFEKVSGAGYKILQAGGVDVTRGILNQHGSWLNRRFFKVQQQGRPYVILKWAQTVDGFIAPADGSRTAISNTFSHTLSHKWRTEEDAIIVGYNTALMDNPALTARLWEGRQPLRMFIDRNLNLPVSHALYDGGIETVVFNLLKNDVGDGMNFVRYNGEEPLPAQVLAYLHTRRCNSVIVEGGTALLESFIDAGLWDEARVFTSAKTFGAGIKAPSLRNSKCIFATTVDGDSLTVFQPGSVAMYPYIEGMEL